MINKGRDYFQYNSGKPVYVISLLTSQLRTSSREVAYKIHRPISSPQNYRPSQLFTDDIRW